MRELNDRVCSVDNGGDLHRDRRFGSRVMNLSSPNAELRARAPKAADRRPRQADRGGRVRAVAATMLLLVEGEGGDAEPSGNTSNASTGPAPHHMVGLSRIRRAARRGRAEVCGVVTATRRACADDAGALPNSAGSSEGRAVRPGVVYGRDERRFASFNPKTKSKALHLARHLCAPGATPMAPPPRVATYREVSRVEPSFGALGTSWSDAFRSQEKASMSTDAILRKPAARSVAASGAGRRAVREARRKRAASATDASLGATHQSTRARTPGANRGTRRTELTTCSNGAWCLAEHVRGGDGER